MSRLRILLINRQEILNLHQKKSIQFDHSKTVQNLQYLANFKGDEQIEELIGLANYILDELKERGTVTITK